MLVVCEQWYQTGFSSGAPRVDEETEWGFSSCWCFLKLENNQIVGMFGG